MMKIELEILKIGFEAGKKAIEMHPDGDEYDTIRLEEAQEQVKNLDISLVSVSLPTPATDIWLKANELSPTEFTKWYKRNVGYER